MKVTKIFDILHYSVIHLLCFRLTHTNIPQHNCTCVCVSVWWHPWGDTLASHKAWRIITLLFYNTYHRCHRRRLPPFLTFLLMFPNSPKHCESKEKYTIVINVFCAKRAYRMAKTTTNEKVYGWQRPAIIVNGKVQRRTRRSKIENNLCTHTHTDIHMYI